uniref:non-specific serine/threonine protein kinase n=1 Tax=Varanus komodoensis TaxID=61221 RepID=A0A8D2LGE5_VARKO
TFTAVKGPPYSHTRDRSRIGNYSAKDYQHCVIKEINLTKMPRKEKESSQKEVRMKHPSTVASYTSFHEKNKLYIIMEYCDGGDLMKRINISWAGLFKSL